MGKENQLSRQDRKIIKTVSGKTFLYGGVGTGYVGEPSPVPRWFVDLRDQRKIRVNILEDATLYLRNDGYLFSISKQPGSLAPLENANLENVDEFLENIINAEKAPKYCDVWEASEYLPDAECTDKKNIWKVAASARRSGRFLYSTKRKIAKQYLEGSDEDAPWIYSKKFDQYTEEYEKRYQARIKERAKEIEESERYANKEATHYEKNSIIFSYDFDEYGQKYWLCPDYPTEQESFVETQKEYIEFLEREEPFILFGHDDYNHCINENVKPLDWIGFGGSYSKYENHDNVNLYLAKAEHRERKFYKIGLSTLPNPKQRDKKAYKELVRCKLIQAGESGYPALFEKYILWRCSEHKYDHEDIFNRDIFKDFAGKSEVIHTQDPLVEAIFDSSFNRLTKYLEVYSEESAYLEIMTLRSLLRAIYDERFTTAKSAVIFHCHGGNVWAVNGCKQSKIIDDLSVGMTPKDIRAYEDFVLKKLLPKVETAWDKLSLVDPKMRHSKAKENYEKWWARKGGSKFDFGKPRYWNL